MADPSNAINVPEGTTITFGSWVCTANGSGGFTSRLITPDEPKILAQRQLAETHNELGEKPSARILLAHTLERAGYDSAPIREGESIEPDVTPNSENFQFSETLRKYLAYLKSIKCPRVHNFELLDGVDRVSRSIVGCIKLAKSALGQPKTQKNLEDWNPRRAQAGDMFSGIDQVDSALSNCINLAEDTLQ